MKNAFLIIIILAAIIYFAKEGKKAAIESDDETLDPTNFKENLKRGFKETMKTFLNSVNPEQHDDSSEYTDHKPPNNEMVSFTAQLNSFHGANIKKRRGVFHLGAANSYN